MAVGQGFSFLCCEQGTVRQSSTGSTAEHKLWNITGMENPINRSE
jgi:hypothetical protein